jgi:hypothetical protein
VKNYTFIVYLDEKPFPQLGDKFEIVSFEDHTECKYLRPYIIATLEPIKEDPYRESDKEIIGV